MASRPWMQACLKLTSEREPVHSPTVCFGFSVAWSPDSALRTPVRRVFLSSPHDKQSHLVVHAQLVTSTKGKRDETNRLKVVGYTASERHRSKSHTRVESRAVRGDACL